MINQKRSLLFLFSVSLLQSTALAFTSQPTFTPRRLTVAMSESKNGQVIVVGSANQDLTSYTSSVPVLGQTVMGKNFETSCGGKGANQAVAAACLGMVPVSMVCRVADDVFGKELLANFSKLADFKSKFFVFAQNTKLYPLILAQGNRECTLTKKLLCFPQRKSLRVLLPLLLMLKVEIT